MGEGAVLNKKTLGWNALFNVFKACITGIFPVITFPYISRTLKETGLGRYQFSFSVVSYFALFAALGVNLYGVREGARYRNDKERISRFVSEVFSINIYSTVLSYIVLFAALIWVGKLREYRLIILLLSAEILLTTLSLQWVLIIFEDYIFITIVSFILQVISLAAMIALVHHPEDVAVYSVISVISTYGYGVFSFFRAAKYVKIRLIPFPSKGHFKPIFVIFCTTIAATIYVNSDITILGWIKGNAVVGMYSAASKIYTIVKQILNAIVAVALPRISFHLGRKEMDKAKGIAEQVLNIMISLCIPAIVGIFCVSKELVTFYAGRQYESAAATLRILSFALVFAVLANFFANCLLVSLKKEKFVMFSTVLSALLNISLNIFFIPLWGERGAAFTTVLAEICVFVLSAYYAGKYIRIHIDTRILIGTAAGCAGIVLTCRAVHMMISNMMIRLLLSVGSAVIIYGMIQLLAGNGKVYKGLFKK